MYHQPNNGLAGPQNALVPAYATHIGGGRDKLLRSEEKELHDDWNPLELKSRLRLRPNRETTPN